MTSFASPANLAARLGVTFSEGETTQAQALLDDATAYLQAELGQLVTAGTATFTVKVPWPQRWLDLPQQPVTDVTEVTIGGVVVTDYHLIDGRLWLPAASGAETFVVIDTIPQTYRTVEVTFDYGYAAIPAELVSWCCVLASQARSMAINTSSLGGSAVRSESEQIDDYQHSISYTDGAHAFDIPDRALENLRARYGAGAYVTGCAS